MSEWLASNWEWILLGFMVVEKIVKLSPSKKDDILFDSIIKPMFNMFAPKKKCVYLEILLFLIIIGRGLALIPLHILTLSTYIV